MAKGIPIVTDKWLTDSARKKKYMEPIDYIPKVPKQEKEWGFKLKDAWGSRRHVLLHGYTVYFTSALSKTYDDFAEVEQLYRLCGAKKVHKSARSAGSAKDGEDVIIFGLEDKDVECDTLLKAGCTVYNRNTLASGILRGHVDLKSDEFKIKPPGQPEPTNSPRVVPKRTGRPENGNSRGVTPKRRGRPKKT